MINSRVLRVRSFNYGTTYDWYQTNGEHSTVPIKRSEGITRSILEHVLLKPGYLPENVTNQEVLNIVHRFQGERLEEV